MAGSISTPAPIQIEACRKKMCVYCAGGGGGGGGGAKCLPCPYLKKNTCPVVNRYVVCILMAVIDLAIHNFYPHAAINIMYTCTLLQTYNVVSSVLNPGT